MAIASTPLAITEVCKWILPKLKASNFSHEDIFAVHLALEEALINAIKHGNKMDPAKEVKVDYSLSSDKVEISMTDEGEGFDPEVVPDPRHGKNLYKNDGRGLLLMQSYMDVVEYNKRGNSVRMVRYKEKPHLPETQKQSQA
ncbi:MAG: ATP-binding protein [Phycisphaerae bacterium]|nr:ATP-binding protein [Phycisphaerae bacterium]